MQIIMSIIVITILTITFAICLHTLVFKNLCKFLLPFGRFTAIWSKIQTIKARKVAKIVMTKYTHRKDCNKIFAINLINGLGSLANAINVIITPIINPINTNEIIGWLKPNLIVVLIIINGK